MTRAASGPGADPKAVRSRAHRALKLFVVQRPGFTCQSSAPASVPFEEIGRMDLAIDWVAGLATRRDLDVPQRIPATGRDHVVHLHLIQPQT
jgi:hypothetical protein